MTFSDSSDESIPLLTEIRSTLHLHALPRLAAFAY
jgi:hypothetical protein